MSLKVNKIMESLTNKKHTGLIASVLKADSLIHIDDVDFFLRSLLSLGVENAIYIDNGLVVFSTNESLEGSRVDIADLQGDGLRALVSKMFSIKSVRRYKVYDISEYSKLVVVFSKDVSEYQIALVDLVIGSKVIRLVNGLGKVQSLKVALELLYKNDRETYMHSYRTKEYSKQIARKIGIEDIELSDIGVGALLHDIGKLFIPFSVLKKDGKLTREEYEIVKKHPIKGYKILKSLGFHGCVLDIALLHHEKIDGSGYPHGVEKVPQCVQIVGIADIIDAIQSSRVYKEKSGYSVIVNELGKMRGKFEDDIIDAAIDFIESNRFLALKRKFRRLLNKHEYGSIDFGSLVERLNVLKSENADLKKEVELYKKVAVEVQKKYESVALSSIKREGRERDRKHVKHNEELKIETAFDLISKYKKPRGIFVVRDDKEIISLKGNSLSKRDAVEVLKEESSNVDYVDLKDGSRLYVVFDENYKIPSSLRIAIELLF